MLPEKIYNDLKDVAHTSATEFIKQYGEPMYCGFADVLIKPARGNFIKYLKENVMQAVADRLKVYLKDHTIYMTSMAD